jgi:hypothetical protein
MTSTFASTKNLGPLGRSGLVGLLVGVVVVMLFSISVCNANSPHYYDMVEDLLAKGPTYYELLEVQPKATIEQIRKAFRKQALI